MQVRIFSATNHDHLQSLRETTQGAFFLQQLLNIFSFARWTVWQRDYDGTLSWEAKHCESPKIHVNHILSISQRVKLNRRVSKYCSQRKIFQDCWQCLDYSFSSQPFINRTHSCKRVGRQRTGCVVQFKGCELNMQTEWAFSVDINCDGDFYSTFLGRVQDLSEIERIWWYIQFER